MKSVFTLLLLLAYVALQTATAAEIADSIYTNARIYTANPALPGAQALAVRDGKIVFVGESEDALRLKGRETKHYDLGRRMLMPGIHDAHSHMVWGGLNKLYECRLPLGGNPEALILKLKECAVGLKPGEWLVAGSAWSEQFPHKRFHREQIDRAFPDTPVFIVEGSQHHAFLNTAALRKAGIDRTTANPVGGEIVKDENGDLTGELVETATYMVTRNFKSASETQRLEALRWASRFFSRYGITSTQESSANAEILETFNKVDREGSLNQTVAAHIIWGSPQFARTSNKVMEDLIKKRADYVSPHVRVDFVKMWIDGSPTPPYFTEGSIDMHTEKVDLGNILIKPSKLNSFVTELDREGIKLKLHVAGAGAAHVALDAVAAARKANPESKIIHELGHTNLLIPSDFARMKRLNVAGDMSPTIWHLYGPTLGNPPLPAWQFRTLHENGVLMTIGTDWPVTDEPDIFPALQGLMDRGYESLDMDTALKMLTINGAISMGWQKESGSLEVGKTANFIVLDQNLLEIPTEKIGATQVLLTVFEGRRVYEQ